MGLTRNLDKAREAYRAGDVAAAREAHQGADVGAGGGRAEERHQQAQGRHLKSAVYGGLDGIITTFAVVAGVAGASLDAGIVLIMGLANLVGDGLSMAIGDYLGTKSEQEYARTERRREEWEVQHFPEGEKRELVEIYEAKGVAPEDAQAMVDRLAKYPKAWLDVMMTEELGILEDHESPIHGAGVTFCSFMLFGFIPVAAYVAARVVPMIGRHTLLIATIMTAATLFGLGALKSKITRRHWLISGLEMLLVGGLAAGAAYGIGVALSGLVPGHGG